MPAKTEQPIVPWTPGPWRACKEGACSCGMAWSVPADFHVATAHQGWGDDPQYPDATMPLKEMQANARLIAAAPDLYEACADWIAWLDKPGPDFSDGDAEREAEMLAAMRAALAKAQTLSSWDR